MTLSSNQITVSLRALGACALLALGGCVGRAASAPVAPGPQPVAAGYGYRCEAGFYQCHTPTQVPLGTPCSCPGLGAASYGNVH